MKQIVFIACFVLMGGILNAQVKSVSKSKAVVKSSTTYNSGTANSIKKVSIKDVKAIMDTTTGPLIVNFWATWCGPCIREIPYFDSLIAVKGKPVTLLLVSLDFPDAYPKELGEFVTKQGYKGKVVFLNESNADYFCPIIDKSWGGAIPASVFVNNDKKTKEFFGFQLTRERFALELDKLVD